MRVRARVSAVLHLFPYSKNTSSSLSLLASVLLMKSSLHASGSSSPVSPSSNLSFAIASDAMARLALWLYFSTKMKDRQRKRNSVRSHLRFLLESLGIPSFLVLSYRGTFLLVSPFVHDLVLLLLS